MGMSLLLFTAAATLVIITPGPDSLLVLRNSLRRGAAVGLCTTAGVLAGLTVWAVASAVGLSALVQASRIGDDALHLAGGLYLVWMGIGALRAHRGGKAGSVDVGSGVPAGSEPGVVAVPRRLAGQDGGSHGRRALRAFGSGALTNLLNPKVGVFFLTFLPTFIPTGASVGAASAAFGLWFVVETGVWLAALTWVAARGAAELLRPARMRLVERVTGVLFIGIGVRLATDLR